MGFRGAGRGAGGGSGAGGGFGVVTAGRTGRNFEGSALAGCGTGDAGGAGGAGGAAGRHNSPDGGRCLPGGQGSVHRPLDPMA